MRFRWHTCQPRVDHMANRLGMSSRIPRMSQPDHLDLRRANRIAYARVSNSIGTAPIEMVRLAHPRNSTAHPQAIGHMINPWLTGVPPKSHLTIPNPVGTG